MNYQTFTPPDHLKPVIKGFWAYNTDADTPANTLRAFPDGSPGIIMVQSESAICDNKKKKLPAIYLHGLTSKASELSYSGKILAIGINFQPHALRSIFGINALELTDTGIDLTAIQPKMSNSLCERVKNEGTVEGRVKMVADFLSYQHQHNTRETDPVVKYAIAKIAESKGNCSLKSLQQELQLSERSLERKFAQAIGISPKLFSRICRFQESLHQLRTSNYVKLTDIAYENEYADQSYFIKVFKEFTGFSPLEFKRSMQQGC